MKHPNHSTSPKTTRFFTWGVGLLLMAVMSFAAACSPSSDPATPTPAIPGPALVQFFTDP
ncbi:MAG: hypothetical protein IPL78_17035 [Chloroflexi bacterium]|nr:hypothetical protein [Chloroflexota bacterium]